MADGALRAAPVTGARRWLAMGFLSVLALIALGHAGRLALEYRQTQAEWLPARGLLSGREFAFNTAADAAGLSIGLRDEFSYEHDGQVIACHWDDRYAPIGVWLARLRAVARESHWRVGMRTRLKIDPKDPERCRPAYGWLEEIRLDLTADLLLALFLLGSVIFIALTPKAPPAAC